MKSERISPFWVNGYQPFSAPQKLHEIGVKEEDLHQLAIDAFNDVCTGGNPRPTSVEDIEALYHKAF